MSLKKYFLYDKKNSNFIPVEYNSLERMIYSACLWIIGGVVLSGLGIAIFTKSIGTPAEIALQAENKELLNQLSQTQVTIKQYDKRLEKLAHDDNELYRSVLGMDPISLGEREAGAGGADIYSKFDVYSEKTSDILKWTSENLEKMERSIEIQESSFENIKRNYTVNRKKFNYIPAIKPTEGALISGYGLRFHPILQYRRMHEGLDFSANTGDAIYATGAGVIKKASREGTFGNLVIIDHGYGFETYYAHLSAFPKGIKSGATVNRGDKIGFAGTSGQSVGPHLHYEVHKNEKSVDPLNYLFADTSPAEFLKYKNISARSTKSLD
jgi:murein DD-endopeptidase MepM/ murein hydrolase activator NlpD